MKNLEIMREVVNKHSVTLKKIVAVLDEIKLDLKDLRFRINNMSSSGKDEYTKGVDIIREIFQGDKK